MTEESRQIVFHKLREQCVQLSEIALELKRNATTVSNVLRALKNVHDVLKVFGENGQLDSKLAAYAFFPLAQQVFNQVACLSSGCIEVAIDCTTLLVQYGYRASIETDLASQLLILMCMLAGSGPNRQPSSTTDEVKISAFKCINTISSQLSTEKAKVIFEHTKSKTVVDQLAFLLLDNIASSASDLVQVSASEALHQIISATQSRVLLASLLPQTVSTLVKALRVSTKARRTQKVLVSNLHTLQIILLKTLASDVVSSDDDTVLGAAWLGATTGQVQNALSQVVKLRKSESVVVRDGLQNLCSSIIISCSDTLRNSIPMMLETLVILASWPDGVTARESCKRLLILDSNLASQLNSTMSDWLNDLPMTMQGHNSENQQLAFRRLTSAIQLIHTNGQAAFTGEHFVQKMVQSLTNLFEQTPKTLVESEEQSTSLDLVRTNRAISKEFVPVVLTHESQREVSASLQTLLDVIRNTAISDELTRQLVDVVLDASGMEQLAALYLTVQLQKASSQDPVSIFLNLDNHSNEAVLSDLAGYVLPLIIEIPLSTVTPTTTALIALSLEILAMHAQTFEPRAYRPMLIDTLYPVLSLATNSSSLIRGHCLTTLQIFADSCKYATVADLLIQNSDYLLNSIAFNLNTFQLTPQAPQVLTFLIKLCGAELIPYLDDTIATVFTAIDIYHEQADWVGLLFSSLRAVVEVSARQSQLVITAGSLPRDHRKASSTHASKEDILASLRARQHHQSHNSPDPNDPISRTPAPQRPWSDALDGPPTQSTPAHPPADLDLNPDNDPDAAPLQPLPDPSDTPTLSKPHALLLQITNSTVHHLSSPSPQIRHLLLDLLQDVSPLLARDETSFLPLVNAVWPGLVSRLFGQDESTESETAYNVVKAAEGIAALCRGAGDFMSSRIEAIESKLLALFRELSRKLNVSQTSSLRLQPQPVAQSSLAGPVDLQIVGGHDSSLSTAASASAGSTVRGPPSLTAARTSTSQILQALVHLLTTILSFVRVTLDTGDGMCRVLLPLADNAAVGSEVRQACERWNAELVWCWDQGVVF